jgi:hypothetical protein
MRPSLRSSNESRSTELGAPTTTDPNAALKDGLKTEETRSQIAEPGLFRMTRYLQSPLLQAEPSSAWI